MRFLDPSKLPPDFTHQTTSQQTAETSAASSRSIRNFTWQGTQGRTHVLRH